MNAIFYKLNYTSRIKKKNNKKKLKKKNRLNNKILFFKNMS